MRKIFTMAALLALLAVPLFAVSADANVCPFGGNWSSEQRPPLEDVGATEYCVKGGNPDNGGYLVRGSFAEVTAAVEGNDHALSHWSYRLSVPCDENDSTIRVLISIDEGDWSEWVWDAGQQLFVRSRTVTEHWNAISVLDGSTVCARGDVEYEEVETRRPEGRITLRQNCDGWGLMQEGQLIDSGTWDLPFELEVAASQYVDYRIFEGDECLQVRGDLFIRIGGRCTEDGDSQEIGYVFDDGDFDGARLIITRQDGVEVANVGEGSDFFPARAAGYSWQIIWFNGETREVLDEGEFSVAKCDLPEPTPTPKPPPEHPPTGGEMDAGLAVVTGLLGFALAGIGGSILFMKRRASR